MSFLDNKIYYRMLLADDGPEKQRSPEEYKALWQRYLALPKNKQDVLTDQQMTERILKLQEQFKLQDQAIGYISIFIRKVFFGELSMTECEAKIGSMLTTTDGGDPNQAKPIVEFIQKEILTIQPKPRVEESLEETPQQVKIVNLPLLQGMSKYEQLGNQLITNERIRIKSQSDPVRPSLVYWIKYYRDELGVGVHDSVQRGNFLFRSENGMKLSVEERERVNIILKSIEENHPLPIDTEKMEIIFPSFAMPKKEPFAISSGAKIVKGPALGINNENEAPAVAPRPIQAPSRQFVGLGETNKKVLNPYQSGSLIINQGGQPVGSEVPDEQGGIRFSSSHVFPAEKENNTEQREVAVEQAVKVLANQPPISSTPQKSAEQPVVPLASVKPNPFHIHPVSSRSEETAFKG